MIFKRLFNYLTALCLFLLLVGCASTHVPYSKRSKIVPRTGLNLYGRELCQTNGFHCIHLKRSDTWASLLPNAEQRDLVMRLNRTNLPLSRRTWLVVPDNLDSITKNDISPLPLKMQTHGKKLLLVNLRLHAFAAYDKNGDMLRWGPISAGKGVCSNGEDCSTIVGQFKIFRVHGENCKSGKYPIATNGGAPMPYCMFYYRGWAVHGSTLPGYHNSHGCVRLFFEDAEWLNKFFIKIGTRVTVA